MGTNERPFTSKAPMELARGLVQGVMSAPGEGRGVWWHQGTFWVWYGGRWQRRTVREMENGVMMLLDGAMVMKGKMEAEGPRTERLVVTPVLAANVTRCLEALVQCPKVELPAWVGEGPGPFAQENRVLAFRDVLVEVGTDTKVERDHRWLDPVCLPVDFRGEVGWKELEGTTFRRCLEEWSNGDERWVELDRMWGGYQMLPWRGANRWLLKHGKIQAGKTTRDLLMKELLGQAMVSSTMNELSGEFGLSGMANVRALVINDAEELDERRRQRFSSQLKVMVGADFTTINEKGMPLIRDVKLGCAVSMNANLMPAMANEGQGVSGKMLVLPYERSMIGKADAKLLERLKGELDLVAAWYYGGAVKVVGEADRGAVQWPVTGAAEEHVWAFRLKNNPWDAFLEARFVKQPGGFVPSRLIWREWLDFARENQVATRVARNALTMELVGKSTWDVRRRRHPHTQERGLEGLGWRKVPEDEGREQVRVVEGEENP